MSYVQWPPLPAFKSVIASGDVYLNVTTPLTVIGSGGGGVAPSVAPVPVVDGVPTSTSITMTFDTTGITGTEPITYNLTYSTGGGLATVVSTTNVGNVYTGTASGLTSSTVYDFVATAVNAVGTVSSSPVPVSTAPNVPTPPSSAPNLAILGVPTSTSISITFDVAGITGTAPISYAVNYQPVGGSSSPLSLNPPVGTVYTGTVSGLIPNTAYQFIPTALNVAGSVQGGILPVSTAPAPILPPSVPEFISATLNSISFVFSTPTQTSEAPGPQYSVVGSTNPADPFAYPGFNDYVSPPFLPASTIVSYIPFLTSSTTYYVIATAEQTIAGTSYILSTPVTAMSTLGPPPPPPPAPTVVSTFIGVGFLTFGTGGFSSIILDTSQNAQIGNWQADGIITYGAVPPSTGVQYLSSVQGLGNKLILSMGGASSTAPVLSTMFGNPISYDQGAINLADSIAYAYFNGPGDKNPLGFARTDFGGFAFDGIDLDIEAATPSTTTLKVFANTLRSNSGFSTKIITAAPQTPYLTQGSGSALNANGAFTSFSAMNPATVLNTVYTGNAGDQESLLSPTSGDLIDYHFIQAYNNASYSYPTGATNGNWNNVVAAWGIQSLQSGYPGIHPKNIYSFASTDGTPIFDQSGDANAFNASLLTANSTIRAFSTVAGVLPYSSVTIANWCAGIGLWAANTVVAGGTSSSLPVLSTMYGQVSTLNNMPTDVTMTYGGVFNSDPWGINVGTPIPNARGY